MKLRHWCYLLYAIVVIILFTGISSQGVRSYGGTSARSGYSSYGTHK
jgi:hypothetical protein